MEEICLSSERPSVDELGLHDSASEGCIEQSHRHVPGPQRLDVVSGRFLRVSRKRRGRAVECMLDLGVVDPEPVLDTHTPWRLIAGTVVTSGTGIGLAVALVRADVPGSVWAWALTGAALALAAGCGLAAWYRFKRRLIFVSRHGRAPLFKLIRNHPDPTAYSAFRALLHQAIEQGHRHMPEDPHALLAEEMREHRRLHEQGVITASAYEAAKARLLKLH